MSVSKAVPRRGAGILATAVAIVTGLSVQSAVAAPSQIEVEDAELRKCLIKIGRANNWTSAGEFVAIKCHGEGIKSLTGLEQFANLESLSLYNNKIKQADLVLAQFPKLTTLNLARNQLTELSLQNSTSLQSLYVFANELESLTVNNLARLEIVKSHNNRIETFTYSNTPELAKVYIFNNQLKFVDIYNLPSLQYMDCRENPMPDELYDEMDKMEDKTILHDGNAEDW